MQQSLIAVRLAMNQRTLQDARQSGPATGKPPAFQRLPSVLEWADEGNGAQGRNRTTDTAIFSRMLYQLSYLGVAGEPDASGL